ncbi:glycosyltransferase family 1 protein [Paraburkholderia sp. SARCC-3016]|uniref:glycosyltransferase family protein n=1 Tax=Paraburkholderia sp. SARCC-3016 TaxID=3058611 RepID=UPI0028099AAD|nr:glycosyltransferase family 1 protein [Paraburkholderia sp. SARCC-3016]MDQ7978066.1 glycosyltransferase family 1 protein [Paraburkholderia sp. SARCC-3016]
MNESLASSFSLPSGFVGRFAVVKLWPELKTAEDECIARIKLAASALGLECVEVHADGRYIDRPETAVSKKDVDFVLHLHYDTPKFYDVFSFVALWNPLQFYHQWGYERTSRNLLSHDDFVSCSSVAADDHVARMVRGAKTHLPAKFHLYHSIADIVHPPSLGDGKLFYVGINWEAVNGGKSRHQDVLRELDQTGMLRIYGPEIFLKVKVWAGYQSYVKEIPFDGVSMIEEISRAGIALVLSSQAHKASELMSNRLFESVAAGALVICDENRFASRFFGDSLLYIDTRAPVATIVEDIRKHIEWAKANPAAALAKIAKAQQIFREKFTLVRNLSALYLGLPARQQELRVRMGLGEGNSKGLRVGLYLLMPAFSDDVLDAHIASVDAQEYDNFAPVLVIDRRAIELNGQAIAAAVSNRAREIEVLTVDFFDHGPMGEVSEERNLGAVLHDILPVAKSFDAVTFVGPNEALFGNHLNVLAASMLSDSRRHCVASATIVENGDAPVHGISEHIEFGYFLPDAPIGLGRFMFRTSSIASDIGIALPHLHRKALAALVGSSEIHQEIPSTVVIDAANGYPSGKWDEAMENEVIADFCPEVFKIYTGHVAKLPSLAPRPAPVTAPPPYSRLSKRWIVYQLTALREKGVLSRMDHLKKRLRRSSPDKTA